MGTVKITTDEYRDFIKKEERIVELKVELEELKEIKLYDLEFNLNSKHEKEKNELRAEIGRLFTEKGEIWTEMLHYKKMSEE